MSTPVKNNQPGKRSRYNDTICGIFRGAVFATLLLLGVLELPTLSGYPQWITKSLEKALTPKDGILEIGAIHGSLLNAIEISDLRLEMPAKEGRLRVQIPRATVSLRMGPLLRGKFRPDRITVTDADASLIFLHDEEDKEPESLGVHHFTADLGVTAKDVLLGKLEGEFQGIRFHIQANIKDVESVLKRSKALDKDDGAQPKLAENDLPPLKPSRILHAIKEQLDEITGNASDFQFEANATGSFRNLRKLALKGTVGFADVTYRSQNFARGRGNFVLKDEELDLHGLHVTYNESESLDCRLHISLARRTVSGSLQASVMPQTLAKLVDAPRNVLPSELVFWAPVQFRGEIPEAEWSLTKLSPTLEFSCQDVQFGDLELRQAKGIFTYDGENIRLDDLTIALAGGDNEILCGNLCFSIQEPQCLSGVLEGNANLSRLAHDLRFVKDYNTPVEAFTRTHARLSMEPSPIRQWRQWKCTLELDQPRGVLAKIPLENLRMTLALREGALQMDATAEVAMDSEDFPRNLLRLQTTAVLPEQLQNDPLELRIAPTVIVNDATALDLQTTLHFDWKGHTLQADEGTATARPELLYALLAPALELDEFSPLSWFTCNIPEKPAHFSFQIPKTGWRSAEDTWEWDLDRIRWQVIGKATMPKMRLLDTDFETLEGDFALTTEGIRFPGLHGTLENAPECTISGDLAAHFKPLRVTFDDLEIHGDPRKAIGLVFADSAKETLSEIFRDFDWSVPGASSLLKADHLEYYELPADAWAFHLDGSFEEHNFAYNGMPIQSLDAELHVDLPRGNVRLEKIRLKDDLEEAGVLSGQITLEVSDDINGIFTLEKSSGKLRAIRLFATAFPSLQEYCDLFELAEEANFTCGGRFRLDNLLALSLNGTLESPYLHYRNIQLQDLTGTWKASNARFAWDIPTAGFHGGKLATTGFYDIPAKRCELLASAKDIPVKELLRLTKDKLIDEPLDEKTRKYPNGEIPGRMDAEGHFQLLQGWAVRPLNLEGTGKIHLREMDLWRVPTLTTLGKIISGGTMNFFSKDKIATLGQISKLDTAFVCRGETISFRNIQTDGSFIALSGNGEYQLDNGQMDFQVSGRLLKSVSLISWILRPISWAFDAQLTGTPEKHEWKLRSAFRRLVDE